MDRRLIAFNQMLSLAIADWDQYPKSRNINDPTMWQPAMKGRLNGSTRMAAPYTSRNLERGIVTQNHRSWIRVRVRSQLGHDPQAVTVQVASCARKISYCLPARSPGGGPHMRRAVPKACLGPVPP
jgi:hypothetical protein